MTQNRRVITVFKISFTLILVSLIIFGGVIITRNVAAADNIGTKYYTAVELKDGDSLWNIADKYCDGSEKIDYYIDELCRINGIDKNQSITSGNYLTVYYYK